jgi:hypothetical protein
VLPAERRADRLRRLEERGFQAHAATYLLVNAMLVGIWAAAGAGSFWPIWPTLGWGLAFFLHGWFTYGRARD